MKDLDREEKSEEKQLLPVTSGGRTLRSLDERGGREEEEGLDSPLLLLLEEEKDGESKEGSFGGATGMPLFCDREDSFLDPETEDDT